MAHLAFLLLTNVAFTEFFGQNHLFLALGETALLFLGESVVTMRATNASSVLASLKVLAEK